MRSLVERLEQALHMWEDHNFLMNGFSCIDTGLGQHPVVPLAGPIIHWHEFRRYLLSLLTNPLLDFDRERFIGPPEVAKFLATEGKFSLFLPEALAAWTRHSRRVFHVTSDLQMLLDATSLEGITWADVSLPFESFAITLEAPINDWEENEYDCILVSREWDTEADRSVVGIRLMPHAMDDNWMVSRKTRQIITRQLKRKQWAEAERRIKHEVSKKILMRTKIRYIDPASRDIQVTAQIFDVSHIGQGQRDISVERASRLVVGLCLYLSALPPGSPHQSNWMPIARHGTPDPGAITQEAEVCTVWSTHTLTPQEREIIDPQVERKRRPYELSAHFRKGHWRRSPGQGSNPNAPKIVWVRPTLVRKDRLDKDTLPGGAESLLQ